MVKRILRSISHWTGGGGKANAKDKKHYAVLTQSDATVVYGIHDIEDNIVTSDGDYAAHTLNLNTGSAPFAVCGMLGAKESPFNAGRYPINERQFEQHCKNVAKFHIQYNILPITDKNCITHAEVQPNLGVMQRGKWDFTRLPWRSDLIGYKACGDYMRSLVQAEIDRIQGPRPGVIKPNPFQTLLKLLGLIK